MPEQQKHENLYDKMDLLLSRTENLEKKVDSLNKPDDYNKAQEEKQMLNKFIILAKKDYRWEGGYNQYYSLKSAGIFLLMTILLLTIFVSVFEKVLKIEYLAIADYSILSLLVLGIIYSLAKNLSASYFISSKALAKKSLYNYDLGLNSLYFKNKQKFFSAFLCTLFCIIIVIDIIILAYHKPKSQFDLIWFFALLLLIFLFVAIIAWRIVMMIFYSKYRFVYIKGKSFNGNMDVTIVYDFLLKTYKTKEEFQSIY